MNFGTFSQNSVDSNPVKGQKPRKSKDSGCQYRSRIDAHPQRQPYAARREVFRDFLSSGLAARKAELPLCGRYYHLVCRLLAARRYRLAHLLLKTRNI